MAEYYGYAERDRDDYIDWAKVGADVTKKLGDEKQRRVDKKAELEDINRNALDVLDKPNIGENSTLNNVYLKNAEKAKSQQLAWYKEMKNGRMTPDEYTRLSQSLLDDNKTFTSVVNSAQDAFSRTKKRIDEGTASALEISEMERIQSFTDFNTTEFIFDPKLGKMVVVKKNEDGTLSTDPNDIRSINSIFTSLGTTINKYDLSAEVNKKVKRLADKYVKVIGKGRISTIDDLRQMPEFKKALDDLVESDLVSPNNIGSILFQSGEYTISNNIEDKGKPGVLYKDISKNIPEYVLTPEQEEEAREIVRGQYESQIDRIESYRAPSSSGGSGSNSGRAKKMEQMDLLSTLAKMYYGGTEAEIDVAAGMLRDYMNTYIDSYKEDPITQITRDTGGFSIVTRAGIETPFDFEGKSLDQFLEAARLKVGVKDGNIARRVARDLQKEGRLSISDIGDYTQKPIMLRSENETTQSDVDKIMPSNTGFLGKNLNKSNKKKLNGQ